MRKLLVAFVVGAASAGVASVCPAWAQDQLGAACGALLEHGCVCAAPAPAAPTDPVAYLTRVEGSVLLSTTGAFTQIDTTEPVNVHVSDRVLVPASGHALLSFGLNCSADLPSNSVTTITLQGSCACAMLVDTAPPPVASNTNLLGLIGGAGAAAGLVALALTLGGGEAPTVSGQ